MPSDELVYCFYRFRIITSQVGQSSQHLNSCLAKAYLRTGDVTHQIHQQSSNYTDSRQILKDIEVSELRGLMFEWNLGRTK